MEAVREGTTQKSELKAEVRRHFTAQSLIVSLVVDNFTIAPVTAAYELGTTTRKG